jgi:hypothetical protein
MKNPPFRKTYPIVRTLLVVLTMLAVPSVVRAEGEPVVLRLLPDLSAGAPARIHLAAADPVAKDKPSTATPASTTDEEESESTSKEPEPEAPPKGAVPSPVAPTQNVVINLINRLVQRGLLTKEDSDDLIAQAEEDAFQAMEKQVLAGTKYGDPALARSAATPGASSGAGSAGPDEEGTVSVAYVPEFVKDEMREQIKQEVLKEAKEENWAAPNATPEWVKRLRFMADVRMRYQGDFFPDGNDITGAFPDFNAINTGSPFDTTGANFPQSINADEDRNSFRLRARVGAEFDLTEGFTAGIRAGTGQSNSPVSQNQSLGRAGSGQGGNFSNYAIWLDRAFIKYELGQKEKSATINLARFDNPFFSPTTVVWDDDLAFDGIALQGRYQIAEGFTPFATAGGFPIFNSDFNFASNQPDKFESEDKWLLGGQVGADWKVTNDFNWKMAAAFYHFENVEGQLSSPFVPLSANDVGDTDGTRPSFSQKGNSYMELRNITPTAANGFGTINQFQYYGLATPFQNLVISNRIDYSGFEPFQMWLVGEFVQNIAFDEDRLRTLAVNNRGAGGGFVGGDIGWAVNMNLGKPVLKERWDWNIQLGYKYVESDAVVDGFTDSDFGGGGTNLQGYTIGGDLLLSPHISAGLNWMSGDSIDGPQFKQDVFQLDITAKF